MQQNYFELFGLPTSYVVDEDALDNAFLALQQKFHPDRYVQASSAEKLRAAQIGALVNDAKSTLIDEVKRSVYMLEMNGFENVLEHARHLPQDLMMRQFDIRERLMDGEDIQALVSEISGDLDACRAALTQAFDGGDMETAKQKTIELRFIKKFMEEIR